MFQIQIHAYKSPGTWPCIGLPIHLLTGHCAHLFWSLCSLTKPVHSHLRVLALPRTFFFKLLWDSSSVIWVILSGSLPHHIYSQLIHYFTFSHFIFFIDLQLSEILLFIIVIALLQCRYCIWCSHKSTFNDWMNERMNAVRMIKNGWIWEIEKWEFLKVTYKND